MSTILPKRLYVNDPGDDDEEVCVITGLNIPNNNGIVPETYVVSRFTLRMYGLSMFLSNTLRDFMAVH